MPPSIAKEGGGETRIRFAVAAVNNNLFVTVAGNKRRVTSPDYAKWQREAGWTLQAQRPPKFKVPVTIGIELCPTHNRRFDLDNRAKPLLDLLVTHQIIADDNSNVVREVSIKRVDNAAPCTVIVRPI